jgi:hypothetical protein
MCILQYASAGTSVATDIVSVVTLLPVTRIHDSIAAKEDHTGERAGVTGDSVPRSSVALFSEINDTVAALLDRTFTGTPVTVLQIPVITLFSRIHRTVPAQARIGGAKS